MASSFAVVSRTFGMPLLICDGCYPRAGTLNKNRVKELRSVSAVGLVKVPPVSVLVVKEDFLKVFPVLRDETTTFMCGADTIICHLHFFKKEDGLPDCIHYIPNFKQRFPKPPVTTQNDLDAVMNAVFGGSPGVEEVSGEASAAPRDPDDLKLESSTALTQQVDCSIRNRRPAHSLKL